MPPEISILFENQSVNGSLYDKKGAISIFRVFDSRNLTQQFEEKAQYPRIDKPGY